MALRVVSTKISQEEYGKVTEICNQTGCTLSAFLKECVMDLVNTESQQTSKSVEETIDAPVFSQNEQPSIQENKISPKIRYQYF